MTKPRDAIVIGAGPAGLSAAIGLLRSGYTVTVVDQRTHWTGRVCGSFLNPEAVQHLKWLGVLDEILEQGAVSVGSSLVTTGLQNQSRVKTIQRETTSLGFPRKKLEEILTEAVRREGGQVQMGLRIMKAKWEGEEWALTTATNSQFFCSVAVLADGRFSIVDPQNSLKSMAGWYGWNATFEHVNQKPGDMSLHLYPGGYVGVLTFADGTSNVCGLVFRRANEPLLWEPVFENARIKNQSFRRLLSGARRSSEWQGVGPLPFSSSMRNGNGALLAGDAAAVGDPFMGEGIGRGLGAGPMIHHALHDLGETTNATPSALAAIYESLWKKNYSSRLRMGHWARRVLNGPSLLAPVSKILFYNPWMMRWATTRFHVGYHRAPLHKSHTKEVKTGTLQS